jgi:protein-disulfide isomerase
MTMNKTTLSNLFTGLLVLCALTVTGLMVRRELMASEGNSRFSTVTGWERIAADGHPMGAAAAPVTIVEFSDFQCPFCAKAHEELQTVRARHGDQLKVVFRHFPLPSHPHAFTAAVAAECAAEQGRFEAYHDRLFRMQDSVGVRGWDRFAADAGVADAAAFSQCMEKDAVRAKVERDRRLAAGLGTNGTPTWIINGKMFKGMMTAAEWEPLIQDALAESR